LRYARIVNGSLVTGTPIQTRAASVFAPLSASAVIYTVATGTAADGLYVDGALGMEPAANGDAGADAAPGADATTDTSLDAGAAE